MIHIKTNQSLLPFNTFRIDARAKYFCSVSSITDLKELMATPIYQTHKRLVLGGGSNILLTGNYEGLVIKVDLKGIRIIRENENHVWIKVAAGENWHEFVLHCIEKNWGGIENLSLIPGTVGAAPMQNIGAYGVEIKNVIKELEAIDLSTKQIKVFKAEECRFRYRESIFKRELRGKFFISSVTLILTKNHHQLNTTYGALKDALIKQSSAEISIQTISKAVIEIRKGKLPDPLHIGNAGSFFKNPTILQSQYDLLKKSHPSMPSYQIDNQYVKVPAGWLIEQCGWKGKKIDRVGVHQDQALVIINYDHGSGKDILKLAKKIQATVKQEFNIDLTPEVNIL